MDRLVAKAGGVRSEATVQSDVRNLLLDAELGLTDVQLETQVGEQHRRIDVEVGCTVIVRGSKTRGMTSAPMPRGGIR